MKVYITERIPGPAEDLLSKAGFDVVVGQQDRPLTTEELKTELSKDSYDAVLCLLTNHIDASVFDASSQTKIYANYAVGFDNLDIEEAQKRGIMVTNTPTPVVSEAVAEHTLALVFALTARICEAHDFVRAGKFQSWDPNLLLRPDLEGKTVGIVGAGRIGGVVGRVLHHGLRCKILYHDIARNEYIEGDCKAEFCENIDDLLAQSDIVTLHVPLNDQTKHLMNKDTLSKMKKGSYLINTARGGVVNEEDLYENLKSLHLAGAALDVFEHEPKPYGGLLSLPQVVLTPHIGSATRKVREEMSCIAAENIISFLKEGKPLNPVF